MSDPAGERLSRLSRTVTVRAAALTGRVDRAEPGTDRLAGVLYRSGGCAPARGLDPRWPQLLLRRAERPVHLAVAAYSRSASPAWMSWTRADADVGDLVHKVYASPAVSDLDRALPVTFAVAVERRVPAWKVGIDVPGLHRADKIVLYLPTAREADETAVALDSALNDVAPQGVPFTGQVGQTGIVSRGLDRDGTSWRAAVCRALADALWSGREMAGPAAGPELVADHAYRRLAAAGFDVTGWQPATIAVGTC